MLKKLTLITSGIIISFALMSCKPLVKPESVMMNAHFELKAPDGVEIEQVNFVIHLRNANTKEEIQKGSIDDLDFQIHLLRGLYTINVDGVALLKRKGNEEQKLLRLRGYLENHLLLDSDRTIKIPLYPMYNL